MTNYLGRGDYNFACTLAYFLTWNEALRLDTFHVREALFLGWNFLLNIVLLVALLWLVSRYTKRPIFGTDLSQFYSVKIALIVSLVVPALLALLTLVFGVGPMTTQRILTYIIGYVVGVAANMLYLYTLVIRKPKDED